MENNLTDSIKLSAISLYMKKIFLEKRGWEETSPWRFSLCQTWTPQESHRGMCLSLEDAFEWEVRKITGIDHRELRLVSSLTK